MTRPPVPDPAVLRLEPRPLSATDPGHRAALEALVMAAPGYALAVYGRAPVPGDAGEILESLPPGLDTGAKHVVGLFAGTRLAGCIEWLLGYPEEATAYIGLLLLAEDLQGRGHGRAALAWFEAEAKRRGCARLRLAVIETNARALAFWSRAGFREVLRKTLPGVTGPAIVMERDLAGVS